VVHHGAIARQSMLGMEELVGADVILVHRLLKNDVVEDTGVKAYVLYTQAAVDAASIDPRAQGFVMHHETTDVAGDVSAWIRDLGAMWHEILDQPPRRIDPKRQIAEATWIAPTPPSVTFEWLTLPAKRVLWDKSITKFDEDAANGRRGAGTTNHCLHGKDAIREEILEWHPPTYWLLKGFIASAPGEPGIYRGDELEALPDGTTRVTNRTGYLEEDDSPREMMQQLIGYYAESFRHSLEELQRQLADVATETPDAASVAPPESAKRFLTGPLAS
jgi:hypothetical protein